MQSILENKRALIIIIILGILALFFLIFRLFYVPSPPPPAVNYFSNAGPNPDVVPTIAPDENGLGGGIDPNSPILQNSKQNIEIIKDKLPYTDIFKSTSGIDVTVFIPGGQYQSSPWELETTVDGMKYLRDPSDPNYNKDRTAFLEAVDRLYAWVRSNGADPTKIYFTWSNKRYVRERVQEWLNSR